MVLAIAVYVAWTSRPIMNDVTQSGTGVADPLGFVAATGHSFLAVVWPWSSTGARGFVYTTCADAVVYDQLALIVGWGVIVFAVALGVATVVRRRFYPWLMDAAWFGLPLMVVILGTDNAFAVEERRLYMPLVGMCALVARAGFLAMSAGTVARTSVLLVTSMFAVALATSTVVYVMRRQDPYTLSLFQYQKEPKNPVYTRQLSEELIRKNQRSRALAILRRGYHDAEHRCDHFAEAELGLLAMTQLVHLTPDLNQAQLMSLRAAYDRLLVEGALHLHMSELEFEIPKVHAQKFVVQDEAKFVTLPRALAWTRTMELSAAEQQLLPLIAGDRGHQEAWGLLALVYARQSKWTQLDSVLRSIAQLADRDAALQQAVHRVTRAKALAQTPIQGEISEAIRDAQIQLILKAPEAARRLLDPSFQWTPTHRELVLTYAQTYIDDRRRDLAVQLIQRTRELDPRHADFWTQALTTVRTQPRSLHEDTP